MSLATRLLWANPGAQVSSALSGSLTTPGAKGVFVGGAFSSIASTAGDGSSDTVEFTNIPQTFKILQIRMVGRVTPSTTVENVGIFFNDDFNTNYSNSYHYGAGAGQSTGGAGYSSGTAGIRTMGRMTGASLQANTMGVAVIDILEYSNTSRFKTASSITGWDANGSGEVWHGAGIWANNNAVTKISIKHLYGSGGWTTTSKFALYGIEG